MQANVKEYRDLRPRYLPKIIGHIPKNKKKEKVYLYS